MKKRRTTVYIDDEVWKEFMESLIRKHGKTHGGIISQEVENAIKRLTERGKTGAKN